MSDGYGEDDFIENACRKDDCGEDDFGKEYFFFIKNENFRLDVL